MFGCFPPPAAAYEGVQQAIDAEQYNGYAHSSGVPKAKEAVAEKYSTPHEKLSPEVSLITIASKVFSGHLYRQNHQNGAKCPYSANLL